MFKMFSGNFVGGAAVSMRIILRASAKTMILRIKAAPRWGLDFCSAPPRTEQGL